MPAKVTWARMAGVLAAAGLAAAVVADASAESISRITVTPPRVTPNISIERITPVTPRININTPQVNLPRNPSRYVEPQGGNDDPPPPRRLRKIVKKKSPAGGSSLPPVVVQQGGSTPRRLATLPITGNRNFVSNEVLTELTGNPSQQALDALARRHRLTLLESQRVVLLNTTWLRWRITGGRSVQQVVSRLAGEGLVRSRQPNFLFKTSQQAEPAAEAVSAPGDPAQYMVAKLHLAQAHGLAKGDKVLIAVIDSGVDDAHPELKDAIVGKFDALERNEKPHSHGTAITGAIAAQSRLTGVAPRSHILAIRAFGAVSEGAESTSFKILKGIDWAAGKGARVINMSFAGPEDPAMLRMLAAAHAKGIVLIAAAGNAGPKSPPLFPAADSHVIAVTATDADDRLFQASNRGRHITIAAPGVDIFVPMPDGRYGFISGTSFAAAHASGVVALLIERKPDLTPEDVRKILVATAKDLGPKGRDDQFGAGLIDALQAITTVEPRKFQASGASTSR